MNAIDEAPISSTDLADLLADIERLEAHFATWDATTRAAIDAM